MRNIASRNKVFFPSDLTLEEVLEAIKGVKGFVVIDKGDHVIIIYVLVTEDTFPPLENANDPKTQRIYQILRECRGIVFSKVTGQVISRRFHKFFNVGEHKETDPTMIDLSRPHVILEKLDGSMVAPYKIGARIIFATKKGPSRVSDDAEAHCRKALELGIDYFGFIEKYIDEGYTPIFEWCSRSTRIILDYPEDQLVLIALRHMRTGLYMPYSEIVKAAAAFNVPVVNTYNIEAATFSELLQLVRKDKGLEGCVILFEDGFMVKVKTQWYNDLNRDLHMLTKTKHNNEKHVWKVILDNKYDDLKGYLSAKERELLDRFANALISALYDIADKVDAEVAKYKEEFRDLSGAEAKKAFSAIVRTKDAFIQPLYWKIWNGENAFQAVVDHARKNLDRKPEDVRKYLAGGIRFAGFKKEKETVKK